MAVPVALVATRADGVPSAGVTNVGLVALAIPPVPVEVAPPRVSTIAPTVVSSRTVRAAAVIVAVSGTPVEAVVLPALVTSPVAVPIVRGVARAVAVQALPETLVWSPVFAQDIDELPVTARVGVEEPDIATVLYFHAVMSPVVSAIVAALF